MKALRFFTYVLCRRGLWRTRC